MRHSKFYILSLFLFVCIHVGGQSVENLKDSIEKDSVGIGKLFKNIPVQIGVDLKSFGYYEFSYLQETHLAGSFKLGMLKLSTERNAFLNYDAANEEVVMDHLIHNNFIIGIEPSYTFNSRIGRPVFGLHFGLHFS